MPQALNQSLLFGFACANLIGLSWLTSLSLCPGEEDKLIAKYQVGAISGSQEQGHPIQTLGFDCGSQSVGNCIYWTVSMCQVLLDVFFV